MRENYPGYISLYKRRGMVSNRELQILKKRLGLKRAGYCGTLDPFAEGVLPVAINKATASLRFFERYRKRYVATILFGVKTDTQDITGKTLQEKRIAMIDYDQIVRSFSAFIPCYDQSTPPFSARKYKGKRLYELARKDLTVPEIKRRVEIDSIKILDFDFPLLTIEVVCGIGTYIRQLCEDISSSLNTIGTLYSLIRSSYGSFDARFSYYNEDISTNDILSLKGVFIDFGDFRVIDKFERKMVNGSRIDEGMCSFIKKGVTDYFLGFIREEVVGIYRMVDKGFIPEVIVV